MKKKFLLIFIIFLLLSLYSFTSIEVLDYEKVKQLAIENNLALKNYENQMKLAKLSYEQALANLYFPSISISSSSSIPLDNVNNSNTNVSLSVSKPIFNGFSLQKTKDLAYLDYQYKKNLYESKIYETKFYAYQYYYQYLVKLLEYNLYSEILKINEKRMMEYSAKYKLGLITELDYISLQLTFSKVQISKKNAENEKELAYLNLKNYLNIDSDFKILEEDNLSKLDFNNIFSGINGNNNIEELNYKAKDLLIDAKKYDSTYLSSLNSFLKSEVNLKYYIASLFPTISSSLGISYSGIFNSNNSNSNEPSFNFSFSISLDLDSLIPGSSKSVEKKILEKEYENAKENLLKSEKDLAYNLEKMIKELNLNMANKEYALKTYEYAYKGYRLALEAFNLGQISASDFASWEEDYTNAKISLFSTILSYQLSVASVLQTIGKIE